MLDRVVDQVDERLLDGAAVDVEFHRNGDTLVARDGGRTTGRMNPPFRQAWATGMSPFQFRTQLHSPLLGVRLHEADGFLDELPQVGRLELVLLATLLDTAEVEHVLDQRREPPAFLADETDVLLKLVRARHLAALEVLRHQPH